MPRPVEASFGNSPSKPLAARPVQLAVSPHKLSHIERIDVATVNPERMSLHSLSLEAKLFVEPDSSLVIVIDHQLRAMQPV